MARGLLWLPLLFTFFLLAWLGTREYQKIEVYKQWAKDFDQVKYDIYSVLGQKDNLIVWGKASPQKIVNLVTFSLDEIQSIALLVNEQIITEENLPEKGKPFLQLKLKNSEKLIKIPFTEIELAAKWVQYLSKLLLQ